MKKEVCEVEEKVSYELEGAFKEEDSRLQGALGSLRAALTTEGKDKITEACQRAKAEFIVKLTYTIKKGKKSSEEAAERHFNILAIVSELVVEKEIEFGGLKSNSQKLCVCVTKAYDCSSFLGH